MLAVAQVMNKKQQKQVDDSDTSLVFSSRDVNLFEAYTSFCGIGLHHAQILFRSQLETRRSQVDPHFTIWSGTYKSHGNASLVLQ